MLSFFFVLALPILPVRLQTSIFGADELNFRVRNGNGWTLIAINTNYFNHLPATKICSMKFCGDPYGNRTHVCGVRGRRLNRLTNGPDGAPSGIRTRDPLIKSQLLYQLS